MNPERGEMIYLPTEKPHSLQKLDGFTQRAKGHFREHRTAWVAGGIAVGTIGLVAAIAAMNPEKVLAVQTALQSTPIPGCFQAYLRKGSSFYELVSQYCSHVEQSQWTSLAFQNMFNNDYQSEFEVQAGMVDLCCQLREVVATSTAIPVSTPSPVLESAVTPVRTPLSAPAGGFRPIGEIMAYYSELGREVKSDWAGFSNFCGNITPCLIIAMVLTGIVAYVGRGPTQSRGR